MQKVEQSIASRRLAAPLLERLTVLAERERTTLGVTLIAAFQVLLHRYGEPTPHASLVENPTFVEWLGQVRMTLPAATPNGDGAGANARKRIARADAPMLVGRLIPPGAARSTSGARWARGSVESTPREAAIWWKAASGDVQLTQDGAFPNDPHAPSRTIHHFERLLEAIADAPDQPISKLPFVTEAERRQLLSEWNTVDASSTPARIHVQIAAQAQVTPRAIAVASDTEQMTYAALDERADRLARWLSANGVGRDTPVGLFAERSVAMVVGMLAILKAGGAYLPLDPEYPQAHLSLVLRDANVSILLVQRHLLSRLPDDGPHALTVVPLEEALDWPYPVPASTSPDDLAYIMYTSGSSGRPKGVMISHRNLSHSTKARIDYYRDPVESMLLLPSFAFDGSVAAIFWTLSTGGRLVLPPVGAERDPALIVKLIARSRISHVLCVSSLYEHLVERATEEDLASVRTVVVGGEPCSLSMVAAHRRKAPRTRLCNEYGLTECTVWSTVSDLSNHPDDLPASIGKPISNTQVYILDDEGEPLPIGVTGELYIGGEGVSRGYLNRPDLTSARFVPHPFGDRAGGARLYRSGDLARYRADGAIEFLGRLDNQVKVRGCRIELEELEAVLAEHPAVRAAAVVAVEEEGNKRLVAFVVGHPDADASETEIRAFLRDRLPQFMIPATVAFVDAFPLTATGKIDRKALSSITRRRQSAAHITDSSPSLEADLQEIWGEVLHTTTIGLRDNFFQLGGDSLSAVTLLTRVQAVTGIELGVASLLQAPTIADFACLLRQIQHAPAWSTLVPIQPRGSRRPLFCVHPLSGNVFGFEPLARLLGKDQPFYGLQAVGLDGTHAPDTSIESMSARYLGELRTICPEGPYFLSGYSLGGLVAFEMARQLRAEGAEIAMLALFDTFNPAYFATLSRMEQCLYIGTQLRDKPRFHLRKLMAYQRRSAYIRERVSLAARSIIPSLWQGVQRQKSPAHGLALVRREVEDANWKAGAAYAPRPYDGPLMLFRAGDRSGGDPLLGWGRVASRVDAFDIPGDHDTLFTEPNIRVLASQLSTCLERAAQCPVTPPSEGLPAVAPKGR